MVSCPFSGVTKIIWQSLEEGAGIAMLGVWVSTRVVEVVVVVVVVVKELFSLVASAICVRIRGQRSEVTKIVYHMTHVFRLLLRSHHSEFVGTI